MEVDIIEFRVYLGGICMFTYERYVFSSISICDNVSGSIVIK